MSLKILSKQKTALVFIQVSIKTGAIYIYFSFLQENKNFFRASRFSLNILGISFYA